MKKLLIILLFTFSFSFFTPCIAQVWSAMDAGMSGGGNGCCPYVSAMQEYNNTLYAGGNFIQAGGIYGFVSIAQWSGVTWDSLPKGVWDTAGVWGRVGAFCVYNGNLIVGDESGISYGYLPEWNGTSWSKLGPDSLFFGNRGNSGYGEAINALTTYNGNLVAAGYIDSIPGMYANNIAYWNGTSWNTFGSGLYGGKDTVIHYIAYARSVGALAVYNGNLIAAGGFDSAGGTPARNIAMWNGSVWSPLGSGINGIVYTLAVYNGNLYAGGIFDTAGGIPIHDIAIWNGISGVLLVEPSIEQGL